MLLGAFWATCARLVTVAAVLPLSALATFILMRWYGMSANLMSLAGLAIAMGMLVDAAVVVVENIETHLAHEAARGKLPAACTWCSGGARGGCLVASGHPDHRGRVPACC